MKLIMRLIKNICFGIFGIYSINILFSALSLNLPLNIYTIAISSFLGMYGILTILFMKLVI